MKLIVFSLPGNEALGASIGGDLSADMGEATIRSFPDEETYVRIHSDVTDGCVALVCTLNQPDRKLLPLYFMSRTAKELGARCTCLVVPYLAYMRQDTRFQPGEGVTSTYFGQLVSGFADGLVTVDPHLHRRSSLSEVYSVPNKVLHAADYVAEWIVANVPDPVLIGPDSESEQWVSNVAACAKAPYTVLEKHRRGDRDVEVSIPSVTEHTDRTPVLIDDIISTARTMIATVGHLRNAGMKAPVCVGVHAIFAGNAYRELMEAGAARVVTCNTIPHESNGIDLSGALADDVRSLMRTFDIIAEPQHPTS